MTTSSRNHHRPEFPVRRFRIVGESDADTAGAFHQQASKTSRIASIDRA